jgi:hypothetical protein
MKAAHVAADVPHGQPTRQAGARGGPLTQALQRDQFEFADAVAAAIDTGSQVAADDFEALAGIVVTAFGHTFVTNGISTETDGSCLLRGTCSSPSDRSTAGAGRIQRHGRANKRLQCFLVNLLAFVEIDGTPGVAVKA